jgi:hypothetical protein
MSNGYGIDIYGVAFYGYSQPADYSVAPFNSFQTDYDKITLKWSSPNSTPWKYIQLVRSIYGYPSTPVDGISLTTISPASLVTSYDDADLAPGKIYYYTVFLSLEAPAWSVGTTYSITSTVLYNGRYWRSLQNSNVGNTPSVSSSFWASVPYTPVWLPAGYTANLTVTNNNYSSLLYNRTPQPYKITNSDTFANTIVDNPALLHYLSLFGYHLDMTKTEYDLYLHGNNPDIISGTNLDYLGQQLGFTTDYLSSPQLRRQRVKNATVNYRLKGTTQSIHNAIASITGWDSVITDSINMLQDGDQAALVHPSYDVWDPSTTYFVNQLVQFNGFNYKNILQSYGVAQEPSGSNSSNTWWQVQVSTTTTQLVDTTTLKNPTNYISGGTVGTGGYSTWYPSSQVIYTPVTQDGIATGLPHPTNSTIQNWNALVYKAPSTLGSTIGNTIFGIPNTPSWSNSTNYVVNNWVSTGSSPVLYWIALKPSGPGTPYGFITPGTNDTFWKSRYFTTSDTTSEIITDGVPLLQYRQWDSSTTYSIGTQIQYFGIIYQAININKNSKPSGYYYSNQNWIYVQPAENAYVASVYQTRLTTDTTAHEAFIEIDTYDSINRSQDAFTLTAPAYLSRFDGDYSDLNGINDNTLANLGRPWTATPSTATLWRSNYGMASVNQTIAGTTTYVLLTVADGRSDVHLALTFVTDYKDNLHTGHGIVFRYQDSSNFWYATRKTLYKVVAGVETFMASWSRLVDGDRLFITANGSAIEVFKYRRDGSNTLIPFVTVTDSTFQTATIHGIMQKYSASGAV